MTRTRTTGIVALIATLSASMVLVSAPAQAAVAYDLGDPIEVGSTDWVLNTSGTWLSASTPDFQNTLTHTDLYTLDTAQVTCPSPALEAPDANGDTVLICDRVEGKPNVFLQARWHFFAEGDLVRQLVTVRNESIVPVPVNWSFAVKFDSTPFQATSSKPTLGERTARLLGGNDVWLYNDSRAGVLSAAVAWGHPDARPNTSALSGAIDQIIFDPSPAAELAPGDTVAFAFYYKIDPANSNTAPDQVDVAAVTAEFASFTGRLVRGLPPGATVQNWGIVPAAATPETPATPPAAPELAETGSPETALLVAVLAAGALLTGGAMVVTRRRRAEAGAAV